MIGASVGEGGTNAAPDVTEIQTLLNARNDAGLVVDGDCGAKTIDAIRAYQAGVAGVAVPDGLISPGGPTYAALTAVAAPVVPAAPAVPTAAVVPDTPHPDYPAPFCIILDLSHNNAPPPPIDFVALRAAGAAALILKATEGEDWQDPTLSDRLKAAQASGLPVGVYHYGTATPVANQITNFIKTVTAAGGNFSMLLSVLDVERKRASSNVMTLQQADDWVSGFKAQTKAQPMVYGGNDYLGGATASLANLTGAPLWQAEYPADATVRPAPLAAWPNWTFWQYTDGTLGIYAGLLGGVRCDRSIFLGDAAALAAFWATSYAPATAAGGAGVVAVA